MQIVICFGFSADQGQRNATFLDFLYNLPCKVQHFAWDDDAAEWCCNHPAIKRGEGVILLGHSYGGCKAWEIARALNAKGIAVYELATLDFVWHPLEGSGQFDVPDNVLHADAFWAPDCSLPCIDSHGIANTSDVYQNHPTQLKHEEFLTDLSVQRAIRAIVEERIAEATAVKFEAELKR
jgi:thioesterase domain-containing protein